MSSFTGRRALITGASSGIGRAMALQLAAAGADVVLVARRRERLEALAATIQQEHGVAAEVVTCDLADPDSPGGLFAATTADGRSVDVLVNNAGIGLYGQFKGQAWERQRHLLQLNVISLTELTRRFADHMLAHGRQSYILNISSIAAFQATPGFAVYGPSKSYVRDFSEAVGFELRDTNVKVSCLCPGPTLTEFSEVAGQAVNAGARRFMLPADEVARVGLKAMVKGRVNVVSGRMNKANAFLTRLFPRRVTTWVADFAMRKNVGVQDTPEG